MLVGVQHLSLVVNSGSIVTQQKKKERVTQSSNYSNLVKSRDSDSEFCYTCPLFPGLETQQSTLGQTPAGALAVTPQQGHSPASASVSSAVKRNKTTPWQGCCDNEMRQSKYEKLR